MDRGWSCIDFLDGGEVRAGLSYPACPWPLCGELLAGSSLRFPRQTPGWGVAGVQTALSPTVLPG